jgi:AcrR family transcriptional regulator
VAEPLGLRERKKARTRQAISEAAIGLFLERGYDAVSVVEIAAAAEVSKRTLFAYFPSKEELVLHRVADHEDEPARTVRAREAGEPPLAALHRNLRAGLAARDPITGLCDVEAVVAFYRLVVETPSLAAARAGFAGRGIDALAAALREAVPGAAPIAARLAAVQITAVLHALAEANQARIIAGASAEQLAPDAIAEADLAFAQLAEGLAGYR